jgi:hypothetical protein
MMSSVPHEIAAHEGAVPVPFRHTRVRIKEPDTGVREFKDEGKWPLTTGFILSEIQNC